MDVFKSTTTFNSKNQESNCTDNTNEIHILFADKQTHCARKIAFGPNKNHNNNLITDFYLSAAYYSPRLTFFVNGSYNSTSPYVQEFEFPEIICTEKFILSVVDKDKKCLPPMALYGPLEWIFNCM